MSGLSKTQQWRVAATFMKYARKAFPRYDEEAIAFLVECQLCRAHKTLPWEYPWSEVIQSLRDRSAAKVAKQAAK